MVHVGIRRAMLAAIVATGVAITGCENFANQLDWERSSLADQLTGSWRVVEGEDKGSVAEVSHTDEGALRIRLRKANGESKATFVADLLATESVHVLQIRMKTYEGKDATRTGFRFRRAALADKELTVQRLDVHLLGKLAEEEFTGAGIQMKAEAVGGCLGNEVSGSLLGLFWGYLSEQLDDDLRAKVLATLADESVSEVEEELSRLADLEVDPYKELSEMRTCIARQLPSEPLGELFRRHADLVFVGKVDRYVRE